MNKISVLRNPVMDYAWGSKTAIQNLLGKPGTAEKPMAELWMGAHPKAPSEVFINGTWESLDQVIEKEAESVLGREVAEKFCKKLPFLFKVLAAEKPLSIQVHPDICKSKKGFERENRLNIPFDAPTRNYKDDNHKPEVLCALTRFQCLNGFRKIEEMLALLEKLSCPGISEEIAHLKKKPDPLGLKRFFSDIMTMDIKRQKSVVAEAIRISEQYAEKNQAFAWMAALNREFPGDIGALAPAFLSMLTLEPGEAVFLSPGMPHAYLRGVGIELMANSDNVLRGGLTQKHLDIPELLRVIDFNVEPIDKIKPGAEEAAEVVYRTPAEEFLLSRIALHKKMVFTSSQRRSAEILICIEGEGVIEDVGSGERLRLNRGQSVVIPAVVLQYQIKGSATLYKASVPLR
jgi:mannose-6-phosphate isomerase